MPSPSMLIVLPESQGPIIPACVPKKNNENVQILISNYFQPGESGIVLLPGGTVDSSADFEPEETHDPPSPCQLVIVGGNVLINGKSSLQKGPKRKKVSLLHLLQFFPNRGSCGW